MKTLPLYSLAAVLGLCFVISPWGSFAREWRISNAPTSRPISMALDPGVSDEPWLRLSGAVEVATKFRGADSTEKALQQRQGIVLSLATGDFDEDGVPDLVTGYSMESTGVVTWQRGNVAALYPNSGEAIRRRAEGQFINSPFIPEARTFELSSPPNHMAAGDFDADGHWDLVTATEASSTISFLKGNGNGGFAEPEQKTLPGKVSTLAVGEVNRRDGLTDMVIAVVAEGGSSQLLIFENAAGALRAVPESVMLEAPAKSIAVGQLDDSFEMDIAVAAGNQVVLIKGRDRRTSLGEDRRAEVAPIQVSRAVFDVAVASLAVGDFSGDHREEIAFLTDDGTVLVMERGENLIPSGESQIDNTTDALALWHVNHEATASVPASTLSVQNLPRQRLISANVSSLPKADLILIDDNNRQLHVITAEPVNPEASSQDSATATSDRRLVAASLTMEGAPVVVLPARLNESALQSLVVSTNDGKAPAVMQAQAAAILTVNSNLVTNTRDTVLTINEAIRVANGTLAVSSLTAQEQAQISGAPANPGLDAIQFNIPGSGVPVITDNLSIPSITDAITLDGTTQPAGRVALNSPGAQAVLRVTAGNSTVRGMVLNRGCRGLQLATNDNNVIEGNFIGTNTDGTAAGLGNSCSQIEIADSTNNVIGGTTAAARNILSGSTSGNNSTGITILGPNSSGNLIQGNYIGPDVTGNTVIGNSDDGIFIVNTSPNNTIGGTTAGAGNLISGNGRDQTGGQAAIVVQASGQLIQGNIIGLNKDGTAPLASQTSGIRISASSNVTIGGTSPAARNIISGNGTGGSVSPAISLTTSSTTNCLIQGNYIGTNTTGTAAIPNLGHGVLIVGAKNITVGGAVAGAGNLISGNILDGVSIQRTAFNEPTDNQVQGNFIGTDVTGTLAIANQSDGISLGEVAGGMGGVNLQIGGTTSATRNVISGNRQNGITLRGFAKANPNHIEGNFIGTNAFGNGALGNGLNGVLITSGTTDGHHIGATSAGAGNTIAFNGADGIASDIGRVIGGPAFGNSIFTNSGLGVDRGSDGVTANAITRSDNTPVLTTVNTNGGTTTINGTLQENHTTSVNYTVQFFANLSCDPSGFGEGQTFIGQTTVNVTNNQPVSFTASISPPVPGGRFITAVAVGPSPSDPTGPLFSSEFSFCFQNNGSAPADQIPLRLLAMAPNQGGDIGSVTSTVTGEGIRQGATVLLRKSGETDIVGTSVSIVAAGTSLTSVFSLTGRTRGLWDLVVTNPDNTSVTLPAAFTIEAGRSPQVWVDLVGGDVVRANRVNRFFFFYGNRGNVDAGPAVFFITLPLDAVVIPAPDFTPSQELDLGVSLPPIITTANEKILTLGIANIRADSSGAVPFQMNVQIGQYEMKVATLSALGIPNPALTAPQAAHKQTDHKIEIAGVSTQTVAFDQPALALALGIASLRSGQDHFLRRFYLPPGDPESACGGTADDMRSALSQAGNIPDSPLNGWTVTTIQKLGFGGEYGVAHVTNMLTSPDGQRHYLIDNYAVPTVIPMIKIGNSFILAPSVNPADGSQPYRVLDGIISVLGGGLSYNPVPERAPVTCGPKPSPDSFLTRLFNAVTSRDPNDKLGSPGAGAQRYISGEEPSRYQIMFENQPSATAPAQEVVITDQLDVTKFDLDTFELGPVAFGLNTLVTPPPGLFEWTTDIDLRPSNNLIVRLGAALDKNTGVVTWRFLSLDPATGLPTENTLAGFLPPNVNAPEGDGVVTFTVRPKPNLTTGTEIRNGARIVFDTNAPIDTPEWLNTIDNTRPTSSVLPLAATQSSTDFTVNWSGTDTGSGIAYYRIYVSENGSPFRIWLDGVNSTSALYRGQPNSNYGFFSLAFDGARNDELPKVAAEASTQTPSGPANTLQLTAATYSVSESGGTASIGVSRSGDTAGPATVNYVTGDTAGLNNCNIVNGTASSRCDYVTAVGTVRFDPGQTSKNISIPIVDDSYADGSESFTLTLSNATGATLGVPSTATVTINDNEATNGPNPIDGTAFFVRQQYIDFLNREPDPPGFAAWQQIINNCPPGDTTCDRIHVSSAFFRSPEFQDRGYFVFRFYSVALGRKPDYAEFTPDIARVSGFLSDLELEAAKVAFINDFMARPAIANTYGALNNTQYVDTLLLTAGISHPLRDFWIAALTTGTRTRAQVLREIAESTEVYNKYFNQAFVVMQYFGYLRRDPDALYLNWIAHLDSTSDYRSMINGFMNSLEYRLRFGP